MSVRVVAAGEHAGDQAMLEGRRVSLCPILGTIEAHSEFPSPDQPHALN